MRDSREVPLIKGLAFASVLNTVGALRGIAAQEQVMELVPEELRTRLRHQEILASAWYPVETYCELLAAIRAFGGEALVREVGAVSIRSDLKSIHRILLRMLSPATHFTIAQRMFPRYFTVGKIDVLEKGERYFKAAYLNCRGWSRDMWIEQFAGAETFLQMAGAKSVSLRVLSGARAGDSEALIEVRWS